MTDKEISDQVIQVVLTLPDGELAGLSVARLSRLLGVDRFTLSRQFKRQKDMTLECFLFKEKMTRAAYLLVGRNIAVKELSERLGFCTCDYFIRKFREYYGIVPGMFKEFRTRGLELNGWKKPGLETPDSYVGREGTNGRPGYGQRNPGNGNGNERTCEGCLYRSAYQDPGFKKSIDGGENL